MTEQTTPKIENYAPSGGVAVDSENELFDIRTLLTGGSLTASLVTSSGPSPIIGTATRPKIENMTPLPGKFIDKDNNIIDWLTLLTNGDLQITVSGIAPGLLPQTFVTLDDETATLPNSYPLASQDSGFLVVQNGTGLLRSRIHTGTANQITVTDGDGINDDPLYALATNLQLPGSLLASDNVTFNPNVGNTNNFNCNIRSFFNLAADFSSAIYIANNSGIIASTGYNVKISCNDSDKAVQLLSDVEVDGMIARHTQTNNNITFGNATQDFKIGGSSILNISASGLVAGGNVNLNGYQIVSPNGQNIRIAPGITALDYIELWANSVNVKESFIFNSRPTDNITHVDSTRSLLFNLNNTTALTLSDAGLKLSAGATINNIDNSGTSFLQTDGVTAYSVQQMIAAAVDAGVSFRTTWDASGGTFPTTGGSGTAGAVEKGNWWYISVAGTLAGQSVVAGDWITALVNTPGQTGSNWLVSYQGVTSVFGRIGPILAADNDYPFAYITGLPDTATSGKLMRGNGTAWLETTATFADTYAVSTLLYASSANAVTGLATANSSLLSTNGSGVPNWNAITQYNVLSAGASGAINNIAPSTAGHVLTSNGASSQPTFQAPPAPTLTFNTVTTSTQQIAVGNCYLSTYAGTCVMPLPVTAAKGSEFELITDTSHAIQVSQGAGQSILYGSLNGVSNVTTTGVLGTLTISEPNSVVRFKCIVDDTTWIVTNMINSPVGA